ncbi:MAG: hypothetical protein L0H73_15435 [Nitrococcus sp.]|nr:hypothetical protein [Nitrococcus sp.]
MTWRMRCTYPPYGGGTDNGSTGRVDKRSASTKSVGDRDAMEDQLYRNTQE